MRYRFIGDTVLTVPFLRNLRQSFPDARIDLMIEPFSGQVIEGCPYVDRVIPFELKTIHTYSAKSERGKFAAYLYYMKVIRNGEYDMVFILKRSVSSALLAWAARVPRRIGFATEYRSLLLTDPVAYRHDQHEVENFLDCLRALNIPISSKHLELWPKQEDEKNAERIFSEAGWSGEDLKVIIHPAASLAAKQWPLDRFVYVMRGLRNHDPRIRFVYTGAKDDRSLFEKIEQEGAFGGLNLCGITSLRENIAIYRLCNLFFGVDSGPMHIAAAVGIPVVALFGPTDEKKWGPWGEGHVVLTKRISCRPCKPHKCFDNECMRKITSGEALDAVLTVIQNKYPKRKVNQS